MKRFILSFFLILLILPAKAQIRGNNIVVTVTPDHRDWNYAAGEKAHFRVSVLKSGTLLPDAVIDYEAGPVMYPTVKKSGVKLSKGETQLSGTMSQPGAYRLKVTAHVDGKDYEGLCTALFSPEKLRPYTQEPKDFDSFWRNALENARQTPLQPTRTLLPDRCTDEVNVYEVSFQVDRWGSRFYGILSVPKRPGRYPALLRVPGAGVRPYQGDVWTASRGAITLEVGIHGIPVTMPQKVYDNLLAGALDNYWNVNLDDPQRNYYRRVVIGCVRAVDYIASLPEWNGKSLGVTGASQGGFLSLSTAALDSRVTFIGVVHDALCDHEAERHGVAGGWPHYFYQVDNPDSKRIEGARYYDGVNFARRAKCPGWFSFGYNDETVPPTSSYSTYNVYAGQKTLSVYPQTGHYWYQEQWDEWEQWLLGQMGLK
jgi:cephalosporin-C deacetylase-like acetyl esterase